MCVFYGSCNEVELIIKNVIRLYSLHEVMEYSWGVTGDLPDLCE